MPTTIEQHIERWKHNREFAVGLDECHCDWIVTSLFYGVLHGIQAILVQRGYTPKSHHDRNIAIDKAIRNSQIPNIRRLYSVLREASNHSRYDPEFTRFTDHEGVQKEIIDKLILPIERELRKAIGTSAVGKLDPITVVASAKKS